MSARRTLFLCLLLIAANAVVFGQTLGFDFVSFDDSTYLTENPGLRRGLSAEGIRWAFTTDHFSNWHPLTWLSYLLDFELYGLDPAGYHATNVLLHTANTLLLFGALRAMTQRELPSAFAAALFAVHPLHVESVAWVAERKDVLSTAFALLAIWAWHAYTARPGVARYALTAALFALGLMAKQMIVTLPCVLLLLDAWPLRRREPWGRLALEKLPLLALSAAASVTIYQIQQYDDPAANVGAVPLHLRLANAAVACARYLRKTVWPTDLSALYPHPYLPEWGGVPWSAFQVAGSALLLVSLSLLAVASRRGYVVVGWLWFLGTLVPVLGLVQVGIQGMADRYSYFPLIGCFIALAWGLDELYAHWRGTALRRLPPLLACVCVALCVILAAAQARVWRDGMALYTHALDVDPRNVRFRYNLGLELQAAGRLDEAIVHYQEVLRIQPGHFSTHNNLGSALLSRGDLEGAIAHLRTAVRLDPESADARFNLGNAFAASGDERAALRSYRRAIRADPGHVRAQLALGDAQRAAGRLDRAIEHYRGALRAQPDDAKARRRLARALEDQAEGGASPPSAEP